MRNAQSLSLAAAQVWYILPEPEMVKDTLSFQGRFKRQGETANEN
jgi:hypothetical protein